MHNPGWDHHHSKEESVSHLELFLLISAASTSAAAETSNTESGTAAETSNTESETEAESTDEVTDAASEETQAEESNADVTEEKPKESIIDKGKNGKKKKII